MQTIWLPDQKSMQVEWYLSGGRATGVESISDEWVPRNLSKRPAGFAERTDPYGPERDNWEAQSIHEPCVHGAGCICRLQGIPRGR